MRTYVEIFFDKMKITYVYDDILESPRITSNKFIGVHGFSYI